MLLSFSLRLMMLHDAFAMLFTAITFTCHAIFMLTLITFRYFRDIDAFFFAATLIFAYFVAA